MESSRQESESRKLQRPWTRTVGDGHQRAGRSRSPLPRPHIPRVLSEESPPGPSSNIQPKNRSRGLWDDALDEATTSAVPSEVEEAIQKIHEVESADDTPHVNGHTTRASPQLRLCDQVLSLAKEEEIKYRKDTWRSPGAGEVSVRAFFAQIASAVQRFVSVGDILAQIDPVHVGIPWAGVRMILLVSNL